MTFEEYLIKKRINKAAFEAEDTARYKAWEEMYEQMHQNSFYMAVKMVINDVRLKYHLREEDVPKTAPTIVAPKPVIRRAAVTSNQDEKTSAEALPSQGASVEKSEGAAATFKPRPVVKRPSSLQKPAPGISEEGGTTSSTGSEEPVSKPRPVIKRPVISKPTPTEPNKPEEGAESVKPVSPETSENAAKPPARPRPVIKRPAALQKPADDTAKQEPAAEAPSEQIADIQPAEAPKPARPRPVIKRPAALAKPVDAEEQKPASGEIPKPEVAPEAKPVPATPRPRPVIKRPVPAIEPTIAETKAEEPTVERTEDSEITKVAGLADETVKPKPPRPRPVIKRPPPKTDEAGS